MSQSIVTVGLKKVPIHIQQQKNTPIMKPSSQNRLHIKGAKIINSDSTLEADLFIEDGIIKQIGTNLIVPGGTRVLECKGKLLFPGGIDPSVHMKHVFGSHTSLDDYYSGTKAALAGCTTLILDEVVAKPGESLVAAFDEKVAEITKYAVCEFGLRVRVNTWNEQVAKELETLCKEKGVNTLDVWLSPEDNTPQLSDSQLIELLKHARTLGAQVRVRAENGGFIQMRAKELLADAITGLEGHFISRPDELEAETIAHLALLSSLVVCPVTIAPVSSRNAADAILRSQRLERGRLLFSEVQLAPLIKDFGSKLLSEPTAFESGPASRALVLTTPPMRPDPAAPAYLFNLLACGDLGCVTSDHLPYSRSQKEASAANDFSQVPPGVPGVEERWSLLWELGVKAGAIDPMRFVSAVSANAAKQYGLYPSKGHIALNSDADIIIWDPTAPARTIACKTTSSNEMNGDMSDASKQHPHFSKADYCLYEGMQVHGAPAYIIVGGRLVLEDGELKVGQGTGSFTAMPCFSEHLYGRVDALLKEQKKLRIGSAAQQAFSFAALSSELHVSVGPSITASPSKVSPASAADKTPTTTGPNGAMNADRSNEEKLAAAVSSSLSSQERAEKRALHAQSLVMPSSSNPAALSSQTSAAASATQSPAPTSPSPSSKDSKEAAILQRPPTRSGVRNMQDSSFSLSGAQIDDHVAYKPHIKTARQPSSKLW